MNELSPRQSHSPQLMTGAAGTGIGVLLHKPRLYDFFVELALLGRAPSFREQLLALARLQRGEAVLDIGCGTGSLALRAKAASGASGVVCGVDASAEMIAWARQKAERAGAEVDFQRASAQALPFPDCRFDLVLSTLMLHHLPKKARARHAAEARRVMRPGGRMLLVDFAEGSPRKGLRRHLQHRHGNVALPEILALLAGAGLDIVASGAVSLKSVHYALATRPAVS